MEIIEIALIGAPLFTLIGLFYFFKFRKRDTGDIEKFTIKLVGLSSAIFLLLGQSFEINYPFSLPEGMGLIVFSLCLINLIKLNKPKIKLIISLVGLPLICLLTFPWWYKGIEGWVLFSIMSFFCLLFSEMMSKVTSETEGSGHWLSLVSVCVSTPLILLSHASISHVMVALAIFMPIVCLRLFFYKHTKSNFSFYYLNAALAVLIINAHIRYVPSPDAAMIESVLLKTSVLLWLLAPCFSFLTQKISIKKSMLVLFCLQMLAVMAGLTAYFYEGQTITEDTSYDYNSY